MNGFKLIIAPLIGKSSRKNNKLINENKEIDFSLFYFGNHNADSDNQDINKYRLLLEGAKYADDNSFLLFGLLKDILAHLKGFIQIQQLLVLLYHQ